MQSALYIISVIMTLFTEQGLTLNLLTTTIVAPPSNASKWQMGFNSAFKGLKDFFFYFSVLCSVLTSYYISTNLVTILTAKRR